MQPLSPREIEALDSLCGYVKPYFDGYETEDAITTWVALEESLDKQLRSFRKRSIGRINRAFTRGTRNFLRYRNGDQADMPFPSSYEELLRAKRSNTRRYHANQIASIGIWDARKRNFSSSQPMTKSDRERAQAESRAAYHTSKVLQVETGDTEPHSDTSDDSFPWPTTEALPGNGPLGSESWPQTGMLSYLGYHVGREGVAVQERRAILDFVYKDRLPNVNNADYMISWGTPGTATRLRKLAESLASFCRNQKRKDPYVVSVDEWDSDLDYLKIRHYDGHYDFVWPHTELV